MAHRTRTRKTGKPGKTRKIRKGGKVAELNQTQTIEKQVSCSGSTIPCNLLDKQYTGKRNQTWDTCINMNGINNHILYLTPNNVIIKSIETAQIPEFSVSINNIPTACKIMIEDKYVSCFLFICGNWYAIMRLLGKTINTEYFARTEKNRAFFKLNGIKIDVNLNNPEIGSGVINIPENQYTTVNQKSILSTSNTPVIQLNEGSFTNIDKTSIVNNQSVFNVLQRFRQQKLFANNEKQEVAQDIGEGVISGIFRGLFQQ